MIVIATGLMQTEDKTKYQASPLRHQHTFYNQNIVLPLVVALFKYNDSVALIFAFQTE